MKIHFTNLQEDLDKLSNTIFNLRDKPIEVQEHKFTSILFELKGILTYAENIWANHLTARGEGRGKVYPSDFVKKDNKDDL